MFLFAIAYYSLFFVAVLTAYSFMSFSAHNSTITLHVQDVCYDVFCCAILETVIAHYELPPASYLCEIDGHGDVLAGVEVEFLGTVSCRCRREFSFGALCVWVPHRRTSGLFFRQLGFCRGCMDL